MRRPYRQIDLAMAVAGAFTLANVFAPQPAVPAMAASFHASPGAVGVAVNAAVIGMAIGGPVVAILADRFDPRRAILVTLGLLAVPTGLACLPMSLLAFAALRAAQGLLMVTSFTISIAYVAEEWGTSGQAPGLMAIYVSGNIVAQIMGRMGFAMAGQHWRAAFAISAILGMAGVALLAILLPAAKGRITARSAGGLKALAAHLCDPRLLAANAVGFLNLLTFVGVFTYSNFHLAQSFGLSAVQRGLTYLVFCGSLLSTPLAGLVVGQAGHRKAQLVGIAVSLIGLGMTQLPWLPAVMVGLSLSAAGAFWSQAVVTSLVGATAPRFKVAAGGLYLAFYYTGGLVGAAATGFAFQTWGWTGSVIVMAAALVGIAVIAAMAWSEPEPDTGTIAAEVIPRRLQVSADRVRTAARSPELPRLRVRPGPADVPRNRTGVRRSRSN
jgi:predicted MFS family arabinose efflux permease